jgi:hypothetical protein
MSCRIAALLELAIAGRLIVVRRSLVVIRRGLIAVGCGLISVRGSLIVIRECLITSQQSRRRGGALLLPIAGHGIRGDGGIVLRSAGHGGLQMARCASLDETGGDPFDESSLALFATNPRKSAHNADC